jgi:hypothetical protein
VFLCSCLCHSGPDGVLKVDLVSCRFLQLALPDYRLEEKTHAEPDGWQRRLSPVSAHETHLVS